MMQLGAEIKEEATRKRKLSERDKAESRGEEERAFEWGGVGQR